MTHQGKVKGLRIRTFNYIMILVTCILYGFLIYETVQISRRYGQLSRVTDDHIECERLAAQVMIGSDTLTEQARLYAVTGDISCAEAYFQEAEVDRNREKGLEAMRAYHPDGKVLHYLQTALDYSYALMEREYHSMKLMSVACGYRDEELPAYLATVELPEEERDWTREQMLAEAQELVIGSEYKAEKGRILDNIDYCMNSILEYTNRTRMETSEALGHTIRQQRLFVTLMFVMTVVIFFFITVLIIRPLRIYIKCIGDNRMLEIIGSYEFKYLALTYNDIYELNAANEVMLRRQAERDGLTQLLNRASFDKLQTTLRNYAMPVALLLIDVDKFKTVNDTYGHAGGDQVLRTVAKVLEDSFRSSDFVARIGGDEFAVVMTDADERMRLPIQCKVEEMNRRLQEPKAGNPKTSLSVGVAFSERGFDDGLFKRADAALYETKERGRCGCSFYKEEKDA